MSNCLQEINDGESITATLLGRRTRDEQQESEEEKRRRRRMRRGRRKRRRRRRNTKTRRIKKYATQTFRTITVKHEYTHENTRMKKI